MQAVASWLWWTARELQRGQAVMDAPPGQRRIRGTGAVRLDGFPGQLPRRGWGGGLVRRRSTGAGLGGHTRCQPASRCFGPAVCEFAARSARAPRRREGRALFRQPPAMSVRVGSVEGEGVRFDRCTREVFGHEVSVARNVMNMFTRCYDIPTSVLLGHLVKEPLSPGCERALASHLRTSAYARHGTNIQPHTRSVRRRHAGEMRKPRKMRRTEWRSVAHPRVRRKSGSGARAPLGWSPSRAPMLVRFRACRATNPASSALS